MCAVLVTAVLFSVQCEVCSLQRLQCALLATTGLCSVQCAVGTVCCVQWVRCAVGTVCCVHYWWLQNCAVDHNPTEQLRCQKTADQAASICYQTSHCLCGVMHQKTHAWGSISDSKNVGYAKTLHQIFNFSHLMICWPPVEYASAAEPLNIRGWF